MALNLGAMISAARSQRNPMGEAITNFDRQNLLSQILKGATGQPANSTDVVGAEGDTLNMSNAQPQQTSGGLWALISRALPFIGG